MGYFFRPRVMVSVGDQNVRKAIADVMEKPFLKNNKYTIAPFPREEDSGQFSAMWRWWGCFIHHEGFKPVIDELFTIRHDPETYDELSGDYDDYEGDAIWVKNCVIIFFYYVIINHALKNRPESPERKINFPKTI